MAESDPLSQMFNLFAAPLAGTIQSFEQFRKGVDEFLKGVENFNRTMENLNETTVVTKPSSDENIKLFKVQKLQLSKYEKSNSRTFENPTFNITEI